jgi:hypothetical protein
MVCIYQVFPEYVTVVLNIVSYSLSNREIMVKKSRQWYKIISNVTFYFVNVMFKNAASFCNIFLQYIQHLGLTHPTLQNTLAYI